MVLVKKGGVQVEGAKIPDLPKVPDEKEKVPALPKPEEKQAPSKPEGKAAPDPKAPPAIYMCSMDGAVRDTPGACPKCKMLLGERDRAKPLTPIKKESLPKEEKKPCDTGIGADPVQNAQEKPKEAAKQEEKKESGLKTQEKGHEGHEPDAKPAEVPKPQPATDAQVKPAKEFIYKCPMDGAVRDTPGPCPKCKMPLDERHKVPKPVPQVERKIYVCDVHPEEVFDKPGRCKKESCAESDNGLGMELEERRIAPGAKLVYVCPVHPEVKSDKPGVCPREKCGKKLGFRIVSDATQLAEAWVCPLHPTEMTAGKGKCPACGREMKHLEFEQVLAVPFSAVIDTGVRKIVFLEKGHGVFDAVRIEIGPRVGEYYQVLKGLAVGDRVVTSGAFLLDAETRLNPAAGVIYFGAAGQETKK